jgi:hypothetical protein
MNCVIVQRLRYRVDLRILVTQPQVGNMVMVITMINTVGELIKELNKYDPEKKILMDMDWTEAEIGYVEELNEIIILSLDR